MPHKHMITSSHAGPLIAIITAGTGTLLAQAVPGVGDVEKWSAQALLVGAVFWLVKQLQDEKKYTRDQGEKHHAQMGALVDKSVAAQHENKMATQDNTAALRDLREAIQKAKE